jgi:chromosome segregation ATPase
MSSDMKKCSECDELRAELAKLQPEITNLQAEHEKLNADTKSVLKEYAEHRGKHGARIKAYNEVVTAYEAVTKELKEAKKAHKKESAFNARQFTHSREELDKTKYDMEQMNKQLLVAQEETRMYQQQLHNPNDPSGKQTAQSQPERRLHEEFVAALAKDSPVLSDMSPAEASRISATERKWNVERTEHLNIISFLRADRDEYKAKYDGMKKILDDMRVHEEDDRGLPSRDKDSDELRREKRSLERQLKTVSEDRDIIREEYDNLSRSVPPLLVALQFLQSRHVEAIDRQYLLDKLEEREREQKISRLVASLPAKLTDPASAPATTKATCRASDDDDLSTTSSYDLNERTISEDEFDREEKLREQKKAD